MIRPKISRDGRGLLIPSMIDPEGSVYLPVAPDIFQQAEGRMRIVFLRDEGGKVRTLYSHDFPAFLFNRPPFIESLFVTIPVLALGILFLLTGLIAPPFGLLTLIPRLRSKGAGPARLAALWSGRAYLAFFLGEVVLVAGLGDFIFIPLGPAHVIPLYLAAAAAVTALACAAAAWREKLFRLLGRLHFSAFALSQALLMAWLGYWGFFFV